MLRNLPNDYYVPLLATIQSHDPMFADTPSNLLLNVIGGLLAATTFALLVALYRWAGSKLTKRQFRNFFGHSVLNEKTVHLVYSEFSLTRSNNGANADTTNNFPYKKDRRGAESEYKLDTGNPVAACEIRSINYLAAMFSKYLSKAPVVVGDVKYAENLNLNFVSLSLWMNYKTRDCLKNDANRYIDPDGVPDSVFNKRLSNEPLFEREDEFHYGIILKITPTQFENRTWIACAGFEDWGTSGAAWYLANKWQHLYKEVGSSDFIAVVKVRQGQDESTTITSISAHESRENSYRKTEVNWIDHLGHIDEQVKSVFGFPHNTMERIKQIIAGTGIIAKPTNRSPSLRNVEQLKGDKTGDAG